MSEITVNIIYLPVFLKQLKKYDSHLQDEIKEKISSFRLKDNHKKLRVHKLKGRMKNYYSFSVTYSHRIIFIWENNSTAVFFSLGDHSIYK